MNCLWPDPSDFRQTWPVKSTHDVQFYVATEVLYRLYLKTGTKAISLKKELVPKFLAFTFYFSKMKPENHMNLYQHVSVLKNIQEYQPPQKRLSGQMSYTHLHSMNQRRISSWRFSLMLGPSISFKSSLIVTKASLYSSSCFTCTSSRRWVTLSAWINAALTSLNKGGGF